MEEGTDIHKKGLPIESAAASSAPGRVGMADAAKNRRSKPVVAFDPSKEAARPQFAKEGVDSRTARAPTPEPEPEPEPDPGDWDEECLVCRRGGDDLLCCEGILFAGGPPLRLLLLLIALCC